MIDAAELVRQHGAMVWETTYRLIGRGVEAADCYQETFVAALEVARREEVQSWQAMLRRLATVKSLDAIRRRVRERERLGPGDSPPDHADIPDPSGDPPGQLAERAELVEQLRDALGRLAPQQAEVFCLRHVGGMSYQEIGEHTGMTANAVGVLLTRVKTRLRELMHKSEVRHEQ